MSVTVELPEALAARLEAEAAARGVSVDQVAIGALNEHFGLRRRLRFAGIGSSTSGRHADEDEQLLAEGGFGIDSADR
jgi:hypothetical protein